MTTFQDPAPLSRRAVRQSERGENPESQVTAPQPPTQHQPVPSYYSDPSATRNMWDTVARQSAQLPPAEGRRAEAPTSGRRSNGSPAQPTGEPLTYTTQGRSGVPTYDGPFRNRLPEVAPQAEDALPPTQALQRVDQPTYRIRDFSPEGRRSAQASTPVLQQPVAPVTPPTVQSFAPQWNLTPAQAPLVDQPHAAPLSFAPPAPAPALAPIDSLAPAEPVQVPMEERVIERTLTRRELRALYAAEAAAAEASGGTIPPPLETPEVIETILDSGPIELPLLAKPDPSLEMARMIAEFEALTRGSQIAESAAVSPAPAAPEPSGWAAPVGHWSTQADVDDESQHTDGIHRSITSGTLTTNSLVLPAIPQPDFTSPITSTGEIMITGSIDLPRSLSSTGASSGFDDEGADGLFDDHDNTATDSAPVRAIRAVSTHFGNGQGVTHMQKPKGNRMLTVLIISAVVMAVVAVGLLVAAMAFNVF